MELSELLKTWIPKAPADVAVLGIQNDSRQVKPGDLFMGYPGVATDGRLFISKAVEAGAVAVAYDPEHVPASVHLPAQIPCIPIPFLARHLADIAKLFYNNPGKDLDVTGITGTNGKTTIAYQLAQAHGLLGTRSAYIGTIGQGNIKNLKPLDNTTPDALCLVQLLHEFRKKKVQHLCMEVSSHALSQGRVEAIEFKQAIFSNLTLDHLDYHKTMQDYAAAKALLFARPELETALVNQDDPYQKIMTAALNPQVKKITYGMGPEAEVRAVDWQMDLQGTQMEVHSPWGKQQLSIQSLGQFNLYNTLAVFSSLLVQGYPVDQVIQVLPQLQSAPGRLERVAHAPYVLVDYAHTPDALENVLKTLNQLKKANLWVVFGCGGDRDKTKRPIMAKIASLYADKIVVTSDNPRSESPDLIIEEIMQGIPQSMPVIRLIDREEAIAYALNSAAKEDIILIAGKGHESYQQIGAVRYEFSDQEVVRRLMTG